MPEFFSSCARRSASGLLEATFSCTGIQPVHITLQPSHAARKQKHGWPRGVCALVAATITKC